MGTNTKTKLAYTIKEATQAGAGSRSVIYEDIKSGVLKARKHGRRTIILAPDLIKRLEALPDFHHKQATA